MRWRVAAQRRRTPDPPAGTKGSAMKHSLTTTGLYATIVDLRAAARAARTPARSAATGPAAATFPRPLPARLEHALWRARQHDRDRYPSPSVDAADLEDRLRRIDRSMHGRFY